MSIKCISDEKQCVIRLGEDELYEYALGQAQCCGFEYFSFRFTSRLTCTRMGEGDVTNYPNELVEYYKVVAGTLKNPLITHCQGSIDPIIWDDCVFQSNPALWEKTQAYGLRYGWSQAVHDIKGMTSMLSLARSHTPITAEEFDEKAADVLWLCNQLHRAMFSLLSLDQREQTSIEHLSMRETEVLTWTAQGKTASDVGMILGLTTRTVNFHISSAIRKLGTSNKTSAVVLATQRGFI